MHDQAQARRARILAVVSAIPHGEVRSYGEVARRAGLPGRARWVARVLAESPQTGLPWHRVLRSDGRIAFAADSDDFIEQRRRLRAEGVVVSEAGRVAGMPRSGTLDAALWGPPDA
ncbi:MGMT family protein [Luteimonas sp. e5]